ncbi:CreA family protein [Reyranella sp.]|uniref:CreA family protein n=1 Tax=Reyranella sp. TaxID=1929291 RepID=UPI00378366A2
MRRAILAALLATLPAAAQAEDIGSVGYRFQWFGPNDKITIEAIDDPDIPGITCYMSRARTGGIKGALGLAEDPPYASISCHQVGPIDALKVEKLKSPHEVFSERASLIFKTTQVVRFWDAKRRALVYLTYTDRIIEGSPQNSISVVPVGMR